MTKGKGRVKKEISLVDGQASQSSHGTRTARMDIADNNPMPESDTTTSFNSFSHHGLDEPNGLMTPMSSFSIQTSMVGVSGGPSIGALNRAEQFRRSMAPSISIQERGVHLVGKEAQVLVDAINDFRKFGVDHVVQLPELVLVGDQSAGKSSLMGALTEIHLPRASGICTRCPALIKTSEASEWTCKVFLHREFKYVPDGGRKVTTDRPFPPWESQQLIVTPFKTIGDKRDLEEVLKWAQIAILNDTKDYSRYIPGSIGFANDTTTEAKFSPNVVSVEISGPSLPSLSFYDLPGIFLNTSDKEDQYLIKVIENLARLYIKRERALIICAIPMAMDPQLSRTRKVISDSKAEDRCVGVLTMADRLQDGQTHYDYEKILCGQAHVLGHGYFITKLPGGSSGTYDPQYHEKARVSEEHFFDTAKPWSSEWKEFRGQCGTVPLQHALSHKFAAQIKASIPDMEIKIAERQRQINEELENLPELPARDVFYMVIQHLGVFTQDMQKILTGGSIHNAFHSNFSKLCDQFRDTVLDMKPGVTISHPSDKMNEVIEIESSDEDDGADTTIMSPPRKMQQTFGTPQKANAFTPSSASGKKHPYPDSNTPTPGSKRMRQGFGAGAQLDGPSDQVKPKLENGGAVSLRLATPTTNARHASATPSSSTVEMANNNPFTDIVAAHRNRKLNRTNISLASIRSKIQEHTKAGLVGVVSPQVYTELCLRSVQPWQVPCQRLLFCVLKMLRENAGEILNNTFAKYQQTQIYQSSTHFLKNFFDELEASQKLRLEDLYALEANNDFTVNKLALELYRKEEGATILRTRADFRARLLVERSGKVFKSEESKKVAENAAENDLPPDPFRTELDVAAYVRGYYKTAALRFVESVCLSIHGKLFKDVQDRIPFYLEQQLGIYEGGEERCRELLEEDAGIAQKRRDLKHEKESLEKFTLRLLKLTNDTAALEAESGGHQSFFQTRVEDAQDPDDMVN